MLGVRSSRNQEPVSGETGIFAFNARTSVHSIDPLAVYWQIAYPPSPCGAGTNAAPKVSHFVVLKTNHIPRGVSTGIIPQVSNKTKVDPVTGIGRHEESALKKRMVPACDEMQSPNSLLFLAYHLQVYRQLITNSSKSLNSVLRKVTRTAKLFMLISTGNVLVRFAHCLIAGTTAAEVSH